MEQTSKVPKEKSTPTRDVQKIVSALVGTIPHTKKSLDELRNERLEKYNE